MCVGDGQVTARNMRSRNKATAKKPLLIADRNSDNFSDIVFFFIYYYNFFLHQKKLTNSKTESLPHLGRRPQVNKSLLNTKSTSS